MRIGPRTTLEDAVLCLLPWLQMECRVRHVREKEEIDIRILLLGWLKKLELV